jgi:outer membrane protein assembly factor BamE (lipoprotein component of BamABCDE complex)
MRASVDHGALHTQMHPILKTTICACVAATLLGGCIRPFRIDVNQGNVIEQSMLDQLRPGMSRRQVQFIMGTPMLADPFHDDRWDYVYSRQRGWEPRNMQRVTLIFQGDRLTRVEGNVEGSPDSADRREAQQRDIGGET